MNSEIFHLPFTDSSAPNSGKVSEPAPGLPKSYGQDRLVALPRDPHCVWIYWELKKALGDAEIRLYFAKNQRLASKAACRTENASHYLQVPDSGDSYYAELGTTDAGGSWHPLLRSNVVTLPYGYPADKLAGQGPFLNGSASSAVYSRRSS